MGGSQLGPYVSGAGRVILVVEDARAQATYGLHSAVNKVLIINREIVPDRITVVSVDEVLGFWRCPD